MDEMQRYWVETRHKVDQSASGLGLGPEASISAGWQKKVGTASFKAACTSGQRWQRPRDSGQERRGMDRRTVGWTDGMDRP